MNQQQLQQILTVAAVVAPMIQNAPSNQTPVPPVNQQPAIASQQNPGNRFNIRVSYIFSVSRSLSSFLQPDASAYGSICYGDLAVRLSHGVALSVSVTFIAVCLSC